MIVGIVCCFVLYIAPCGIDGLKEDTDKEITVAGFLFFAVVALLNFFLFTEDVQQPIGLAARSRSVLFQPTDATTWVVGDHERVTDCEGKGHIMDDGSCAVRPDCAERSWYQTRLTQHCPTDSVPWDDSWCAAPSISIAQSEGDIDDQVAVYQGTHDSCLLSNNGQCDEYFGGTCIVDAQSKDVGKCEGDWVCKLGTDTADCSNYCVISMNTRYFWVYSDTALVMYKLLPGNHDENWLYTQGGMDYDSKSDILYDGILATPLMCLLAWLCCVALACMETKSDLKLPVHLGHFIPCVCVKIEVPLVDFCLGFGSLVCVGGFISAAASSMLLYDAIECEDCVEGDPCEPGTPLCICGAEALWTMKSITEGETLGGTVNFSSNSTMTTTQGSTTRSVPAARPTILAGGCAIVLVIMVATATRGCYKRGASVQGKAIKVHKPLPTCEP